MSRCSSSSVLVSVRHEISSQTKINPWERSIIRVMSNPLNTSGFIFHFLGFQSGFFHHRTVLWSCFWWEDARVVQFCFSVVLGRVPKLYYLQTQPPAFLFPLLPPPHHTYYLPISLSRTILHTCWCVFCHAVSLHSIITTRAVFLFTPHWLWVNFRFSKWHCSYFGTGERAFHPQERSSAKTNCEHCWPEYDCWCCGGALWRVYEDLSGKLHWRILMQRSATWKSIVSRLPLIVCNDFAERVWWFVWTRESSFEQQWGELNKIRRFVFWCVSVSDLCMCVRHATIWTRVNVQWSARIYSLGGAHSSQTNQRSKVCGAYSQTRTVYPQRKKSTNQHAEPLCCCWHPEMEANLVVFFGCVVCKSCSKYSLKFAAKCAR